MPRNEEPMIVLRISEHHSGDHEESDKFKLLRMEDVLEWETPSGERGLWSEIVDHVSKRRRIMKTEGLKVNIKPEKLEKKIKDGLEIVKEAIRETIQDGTR